MRCNKSNTRQKLAEHVYFSKPSAPPSPPNQSDKKFANDAIEEIVANQDPHDGNQRALTTKPKSSPVQKQQGSSQWTVSTGANRDSRNVEATSPIPPVTPTIGLHISRKNYSKELRYTIKDYLDANESFEKAVANFRNQNKGNKEHLWQLYNDAMEKYVAYHVIAKEEGNFVQPMAAHIKSTKDIEKMPPTPPAPQDPPKPISPIDHVIAMAKKDAIFYYEGKEISSDTAIDLLKKNKDLNIDSRSEKGKRPVVKLSKEPFRH